MKTTTLLAITSPLAGTIIKLDINGHHFCSNAHARRLLWSDRYCYVLLT